MILGGVIMHIETIKLWEDRKPGNLKNGWDFLAFNYDADQIINVLKYGKELNKSLLITSSICFGKQISYMIIMQIKVALLLKKD